MTDEPAATEASTPRRRWWQKKRWLLPIVGVLGLLLGSAVAAPAPADSDGEVAQLREQVAALEAELDAADEAELDAADEAEPAAAVPPTVEAETTATPTATPEPVVTTEPPPEPMPAGDVEGSCDYLLGFGEDLDDPDNHRFVASADLINRGNVGIVLRVEASWDQIGAEPVTARKRVRVPYGETVDVQFDVPASGDQIDRHQSLSGAENCSFDAEILRTFGEVHDLDV